MKRQTPERDLQVAYFNWLRKQDNPILKTIHATGNGNYKNIVTAKKSKEEGMLAGVWDVFIPFPSIEGEYPIDYFIWNGLWIEFKSNSGRLTPEQKWFKDTLKDFYKFEVVRDLETAIKITEDWLAGF